MVCYSCSSFFGSLSKRIHKNGPQKYLLLRLDPMLISAKGGLSLTSTDWTGTELLQKQKPWKLSVAVEIVLWKWEEVFTEK